MLPLLKRKAPEIALFASGRSALCDRPRIPPHSLARTERPPFFRLNLLEHSCRSELTGRARGASRFARSLDAMAAREALAAPIDHKMLWPRETAPVDQRMLWPRERRWPLQLIKECYGRARCAGRSNGSLPLLVACEQVICRQISWWRRSVLARADTRIRPLSSSPTLVAVIVLTVPRAQKKKTNALQAGPPR